jgi:hypothetical protein
MTINKEPINEKDKDRDTFVRQRLREFDDVAYESERN